VFEMVPAFSQTVVSFALDEIEGEWAVSPLPAGADHVLSVIVSVGPSQAVQVPTEPSHRAVVPSLLKTRNQVPGERDGGWKYGSGSICGGSRALWTAIR
jgi:hypothetical protein